MQQAKLDDNIFLRQNGDHLPMCIAVENINILIVQYASMFVFNSALKRLNDTLQSKSKVIARWIVVKVSDLING